MRASIAFPAHAIAAIVIASVGCGDPSVTAIIDARAYRDLEVLLHVLVVPDPVTCDRLAFGDDELEALLPNEVERISFRSRRESTIDALDRSARIVLVAEAVDVAGTRLALGCAEVEHGESGRTIALEPVAFVETPEGTSFRVGPDGTAPLQTLLVEDARGEPLSSVPARHALVSSSGRGPAQAISSDARGELVLQPSTPSRTGPFAVDVRVRWGSKRSILLTSFLRPPAELSCIPADVSDFVLGRFSSDGSLGVARLIVRPTGPRSRDLSLEFCRFGRTSDEALSCPRENAVDWSIAGDPSRLFLLESVPPERDRVLVLTTGGWWEVGADRTRASWPQGSAPMTVAASGPCPKTVEIVTFDGAALRAFRQSGEVPALPLSGTLTTSGCVAQSQGGSLRTYVTAAPPEQGGGAIAFGHDPESGFAAPVPWIGPSTAFGFAHPLGDDPALLLGAQFALNSIVLTRAIFERSGSALAVSALGFDVLPALPITIASGDLDGDQRTDISALLVTPRPDSPAPALSLWAALAREASGVRISGATDIDDLSLGRPTLWLGDIDADGDSDFALVGNAPRPSCPTPLHFITLRSE